MPSEQEEILPLFSPHQQNMDFISASMESSKNVSVPRKRAWRFIIDTTPHSPASFLFCLCIALGLSVTMRQADDCGIYRVFIYGIVL